MSDPDKKTVIDIALPLPMPVVGTLMKLIGAAYPNAQFANSYSGLRFVIPSEDQPRAIPEDFKPVAGTDDDVDVTSFGPDGIGLSTPPALAAACLNIMKASFAENPDAENYLETQCYDQNDQKSYVLTFRRGTGKTPHQLREQAEQERDTAKKELEKVQSELQSTKETLHALLKETKKLKTAGREKKRKLRTLEELDSLPGESIIRSQGTVAIKRYSGTWDLPNLGLRTASELLGYSKSWNLIAYGD